MTPTYIEDSNSIIQLNSNGKIGGYHEEKKLKASAQSYSQIAYEMTFIELSAKILRILIDGK